MCYTQFSGRNFFIWPYWFGKHYRFTPYWFPLRLQFTVENFPLHCIWIQEDTAGSIHYFIRVCAFQSILEGTKKGKKYVGTFSRIRKINGSDVQFSTCKHWLQRYFLNYLPLFRVSQIGKLNLMFMVSDPISLFYHRLFRSYSNSLTTTTMLKDLWQHCLLLLSRKVNL